MQINGDIITSQYDTLSEIENFCRNLYFSFDSKLIAVKNNKYNKLNI